MTSHYDYNYKKLYYNQCKHNYNNLTNNITISILTHQKCMVRDNQVLNLI